jgi:L-arabinose transport system substrate-binding protein
VIEDSSGKPVPFVGFDGVAMGTEVGKKAAELYNESGWQEDAAKQVRVLNVELPELSVCNDRTNAAKENFLAGAEGFDASTIVNVPYDGTAEKALANVAPKVTASPDVTNWVVWSCNDEGVSGALRALENAGVSPDDVIGVGLGAYMACGEWKSGKPSGFKAALFIDGKDVGSAAVQVLHDAVSSDAPLPPETIVDTAMVTPEDYEQSGLTCK